MAYNSDQRPFCLRLDVLGQTGLAVVRHMKRLAKHIYSLNIVVWYATNKWITEF